MTTHEYPPRTWEHDHLAAEVEALRRERAQLLAEMGRRTTPIVYPVRDARVVTATCAGTLAGPRLYALAQAIVAEFTPPLPAQGRQKLRRNSKSEWEWFGSPGHFICAEDCRFHLCTRIGEYLVSTVGQLLPDAGVREIEAKGRGIQLEGRGDARRADYMRKVGYMEIGCGRTYETMVFRTTGSRCTALRCNCGLPIIVPSELDMEGYQTAGDATRGHLRMCERWAEKAGAT